ncbi:MAG: hypothetical protein DRQ55_07735 [Planctomycetota bacterium]|nr:MAG: hypothetical protein DRQ55_07735 [Planctomycetota bacterium]
MRDVRALCALTLLLGSLGLACSPVRKPREIHTHMRGQADAAVLRRAAGEPELQRALARGVATVDPEREGLDALAALEDAQLEQRWQAPKLGVNLALRREAPAGWGRQVLMWLPDRVMDLFDVVSFDLGLGAGLGVDAHLTRAAQLGAEAGASMGLGWHGQRSLGLRMHHSKQVAAGPWGQGFVSGFDQGTGDRRMGGASFDGAEHQPELLLYQEWRDYWAVGARGQLLISAELDLHPVQLWDFLAGIVGFDPLNDDRAHTQVGRLSAREELGMLALRETLASPQALSEYRAWVATRQLPPAEEVSPPADAP